MEKVIFGFIIFIVGASAILFLVQSREKRRVLKGIKLIVRWYDYIVRHPVDFEIETVLQLGDEVDKYLSETAIGPKVMYFAPKMQNYIVNRYGSLDGETLEDAFKRLAFWESDNVKLEVYWTLIRGNFAEYSSKKKRGENPDFVNVSAPISIVRRYWRGNRSEV